MYCSLCDTNHADGEICSCDMNNQFKPAKKLQYVGFWKRFFAHLIDVILLLVPLVVIFSLFGYGLGQLIAYYLVAVLYLSLTESSSSQGIIGKKIFKIKVTDTSGNRISLRKALARNIFKLVTFIINIGIIISGLAIILSKNRQSLHDMFVDTYVVANQ